jgi:hypothetical protein
MRFDLYKHEYDPKYILCVKCGRYVRINRDCECDLLDNIRKSDSIDITKRYTKEMPQIEGSFIIS